MKKSLLALAVLGAFAGVASAQSSVTLYGRVDLSAGKGAGVEQNSLANGSGSRFGVRGVEDLGGGLQALFNIEHRYNADTGAQTNGARFWTGRSLVGLQGGFGQIVFGRRATVSLISNAWGELRLGRDYRPDFWNQTIFDAVGTNGLGSSLNVRQLYFPVSSA